MSATVETNGVTSVIRRSWRTLDSRSVNRLRLLCLYGIFIAGLDTLALILVFALMSLLNNQPLPHAAETIARHLQIDESNHYRSALILLSIAAVLFVVRSLLSVLGLWLTIGAGYDAAASLVSRLLRGHARAPQLVRLDRNPAETLRTVLFSVEQMVMMIVVYSVYLVSNYAVAVAVGVGLLVASPLVALTATAYFCLIGLVWVTIARRRLAQQGLRVQQLQEQRSRLVLQGLGAAKELQLRGRALFYAEEAIDKTLGINAAMRTGTVASGSVRYMLESSLVVGAVLVVAAAGLTGGQDSILPSISVILAGAFRFLPALNQVLYLTNQIQFNGPACDFVENELRTFGRYASESEPSSLDRAIDLPLRLERELRLERVTFRYPTRPAPILRGIDLSVRPGESIGIIGPSGSGKSTLLDIILGLLEPDSGLVLVDGERLETRRESWQRTIGYVPQDVYLVDDTMRANIALGWRGKEIDDEAIAEATRLAGLEDVIQTLPDGLETIVGDRGTRLSGGQRQRIGIARALYTHPVMLVLDEATSNLDRATERRIVETLAKLGGHVTMIMVTHRIASLRGCDRIFYLEAGAFRAEGTYDELRESLPSFDGYDTPHLGSAAELA